jgi:U3 small nucleolar ribonucleoprotein protein IMP3
LKADDPFRIAMTEQLLEKLYRMGIITTTTSLQKAEEISASAICRRRLPVVMVRMKMAETLQVAVTFIEQGQVRVGPNVVTDPAFLVTRNMEDFVTWVDSSKVRRAVHKYNEKLDDFDLL